MATDDTVQARITGFWSAVAPQYEGHEGNVPVRDSAEFRAWVDALRALLPAAPADVLDVATGTGFAALIAAGLGHRVTGIDLAAPMLAEARKASAAQGREVRFELRDAVSPGFGAASFDAIVCRHFLWTLREPEAALRGWRELLRPGGRVVAIDGFWFPATEPDTVAAPQEAELNLFDRHYTRQTRAALPGMGFTRPDSFVALFERAGFAEVEVSHLTAVHAAAQNPPGAEPWYVILARRGSDS